MKIDARKWMGACLMAACLTATAGVLSATRAVHHVLGNTSTDTVSVRNRVGEMGVRHRMSTSLYPVQMQVMRGMVRIQSEHLLHQDFYLILFSFNHDCSFSTATSSTSSDFVI